MFKKSILPLIGSRNFGTVSYSSSSKMSYMIGLSLSAYFKMLYDVRDPSLMSDWIPHASVHFVLFRSIMPLLRKRKCFPRVVSYTRHDSCRSSTICITISERSWSSMSISTVSSFRMPAYSGSLLASRRFSSSSDDFPLNGIVHFFSFVDTYPLNNWYIVMPFCHFPCT